MDEKKKLTDESVDLDFGLNGEQVADRVAKGFSNNVKIGTSKSIWTIFASNIFTFFNLLCTAIFVWMATIVRTFNDLKNLTFMGIILLNTLIGIIQEIKAKKTMDKLSFLSSPDIEVLRGGKPAKIKLNEIVLHDIMILSTGNQICSDSIILDGEAEVNESMLTGESLPIKKFAGDTVFSGSFVVSGKCKVKVVNVGTENYIQKLALEAKQFKKPKSELVKSLKTIMKIIAIVIIPIGILAFFSNFNVQLNQIVNHGESMFASMYYLKEYTPEQLFTAYREAVTPTSASLIGMIPTGMFLLTSVALAVGIVRLAKRKALVQELYSIETLARVDMLCLDKTGTITDGTMSVKEVRCFSKQNNTESIKAIISSMQFALSENNQTALALKNYFGVEEHNKASYVVPFSSERKCSAVQFENSMYIIGAPEYVTGKISDSWQSAINEYSKFGYRCLLLAEFKGISKDKSIPKNAPPIALIVIEDNIKQDVIPVIKYFKENNVDVRVISGDNPLTVSVIAQKVGIVNADKYLSLKDMTDEAIVAVAKEYTVFGRVSPSQKKLLIHLFKQQGHTVAMTGDGINDILAMKEADCSIAMANGSEATRNMAQLVLMDSNFSSMPKIVSEGRRVVNNIERSSALFLTKTVFSALLTIILVFMKREFPIDNIQLTFVSVLAIGFPSFVMALEPNDNPIKGRFISNLLKQTLPGALALVICVLGILFLENSNQIAISQEGLKTMVMLAIFANFIIIIANMCTPFNKVRAGMLTLVLSVAFISVIVFPMFEDQRFNLFNIAKINLNIVVILLAFIFVCEKLIKFGNYLIKKYWAGDIVFEKKLKQTSISQGIEKNASVTVGSIAATKIADSANTLQADSKKTLKEDETHQKGRHMSDFNKFVLKIGEVAKKAVTPKNKQEKEQEKPQSRQNADKSKAKEKPLKSIESKKKDKE